MPHIQAALETWHVLGIARMELASAEAIANASDTAVFVVTPEGRVLHCNSAARRLITAGDRIILGKRDLLLPQAAGDRPQFKELLRNAVRSGAHFGSRPSHALALPRSNGVRPLSLLTSPVVTDPADDSTRNVLLLVDDPEKPVQVLDDLLRKLYGLTPAETDIANGLLTGCSIVEIAAFLHASPGTVRHPGGNLLVVHRSLQKSAFLRVQIALGIF